MPTQTITPPVQRKIGQDIFHAVYPHSFNFQIELPFSDAIDFIRQIGTYNEFEPGDVIDSLERIDRLLPRSYYGEENPNNGERDYCLSIGRNPSPLICIKRHESSIRNDGLNWLTEQTMKNICLDMELCGRADDAYYRIHESGISRSVNFRFWWD